MNIFGWKKDAGPSKGELKNKIQQLETHIVEGKKLVHRLSDRLAKCLSKNEHLKTEVQLAYSYLSLLAFENGIPVEYSKGPFELTLKKEDIDWAKLNLRLSGRKSEDGKFIIFVATVTPTFPNTGDYSDGVNTDDTRESSSESNNDFCNGEESSMEQLSSEESPGGNETQEDSGNVELSGSDSVDGQGKAEDTRIMYVDFENLH
jgi:hypothetical protein